MANDAYDYGGDLARGRDRARAARGGASDCARVLAWDRARGHVVPVVVAMGMFVLQRVVWMQVAMAFGGMEINS